MPSPLTGGAGGASSPSVSLAPAPVLGFGSGSAPVAARQAVQRLAAAVGAAFLAPGRLAPAAMPRPFTGAAGAWPRSGLGGRFAGASAGAALRWTWRRSLLGAGPLGAAGDTQALDGRGGSLGFGARPARWPLRGLGPRPARGLLGAGSLGAAGDTQTGDRLGGLLRARRAAGLGGLLRADSARCLRGCGLGAAAAFGVSLGGLLGGRALLRQRHLVAVERPEQHLGDVEHLDARCDRPLRSGR